MGDREELGRTQSFQTSDRRPEQPAGCPFARRSDELDPDLESVSFQQLP